MAVFRLREAETLHQGPHEARHLRSRRAAHEVEFVEDEKEVGLRIALDPGPGAVEDRCVDFAG